MAVRQYIGARYVPKFYENPNGTADWLPNVTYEPLTIVTYGPNTYTSKKFVPASVGDPANNSEYWVCTSNYNAFINELQEEINDITSDVEDVNFNRNKKIAIITDSYGISTDALTPFTEYFRQFAGLTNNINFISKYIAGAGFAANTVLFTDVIDALYNSMPDTLSANELTDLIICGGLNDHAVTSGLDTAISNTVSYAKTKFPNAKIYIAQVGNAWDFATRKDLLENVIPYYSDCGRYGAIPLPNMQYVMINKKYFQTDGTHPNNVGSQAIASALFAAFNNGYTKHDVSTLTISNDTANDVTVTVQWTSVVVDNNITRIRLHDLRADYSAVKTVSAGSQSVGLFTSDVILGNQNNYGTARFIAYGGNDDGFEASVPIFYAGGRIYITIPKNLNISGYRIYSSTFLTETLDI